MQVPFTAVLSPPWGSVGNEMVHPVEPCGPSAITSGTISCAIIASGITASRHYASLRNPPYSRRQQDWMDQVVAHPRFLEG